MDNKRATAATSSSVPSQTSSHQTSSDLDSSKCDASSSQLDAGCAFSAWHERKVNWGTWPCMLSVPLGCSQNDMRCLVPFNEATQESISFHVGESRETTVRVFVHEVAVSQTNGQSSN